MATPTIKLNHLAVVVEDISTALAFWQTALGLPLASVTRDAGEEVDIAFLPLGEEGHDGEIELLAPINDSSGVARYLAKRGAGLHHVCLEVADIDSTTARLRKYQIELINDTPKQKPDGTRYSFVHPRSTGGVLVELYELPDNLVESNSTHSIKDS
jgi:methylmalonyl-CoA/ethylmalonyl-CoA epimerase